MILHLWNFSDIWKPETFVLDLNEGQKYDEPQTPGSNNLVFDAQDVISCQSNPDTLEYSSFDNGKTKDTAVPTTPGSIKWPTYMDSPAARSRETFGMHNLKN